MGVGGGSTNRKISQLGSAMPGFSTTSQLPLPMSGCRALTIFKTLKWRSSKGEDSMEMGGIENDLQRCLKFVQSELFLLTQYLLKFTAFLDSISCDLIEMMLACHPKLVL